VTWPPPYRGPAGSGPASHRRFPPPGWPSSGELDYAKEIIVVLILLLALPYLVYTLLTRPSAVVGGAAKQVIVRRVSG
jgi:hypothetical protein